MILLVDNFRNILSRMYRSSCRFIRETPGLANTTISRGFEFNAMCRKDSLIRRLMTFRLTAAGNILFVTIIPNLLWFRLFIRPSIRNSGPVTRCVACSKTMLNSLLLCRRTSGGYPVPGRKFKQKVLCGLLLAAGLIWTDQLLLPFWPGTHGFSFV